MESTVITRDLFPTCRGTKCDKGMECVLKEGCQYRSSADEFRESLAGVPDATGVSYDGMELYPKAKEIVDFDGTITGKGYKGSMDDPRKVPLTLIPPIFIWLVGKVLKFGMRKYARGQWMKGMSFSEVLDAAKRHISAIESGEDIDPESGEPHIGHVGCCMAFLAWFMYGPRAGEYKQFDDRLFK